MKIVFTGPESSGKTTLSNWLSVTLNLRLIPEIARNYLTNVSIPYTKENVREIGLLQKWEETITLKTCEHVVSDTDLLTILIWQEEKFGFFDQDFYEEWAKSKSCFYFLCAPDIPWEYDHLRENPLDRPRLYEKYESILQKEGKPYQILSGSIEERRQSILSSIYTIIPEFY